MEEDGGVAADYMTVAGEKQTDERELAPVRTLDRPVLKRPAV